MTDYKSLQEFKNILVDHLPYEVMWLDEEGRIVYANERFCRKLGYSKSEVLKLGISDINPSVTPESWKAHFQELRMKGELMFYATHKTRRGNYFESEVFAHIFSNNRKEIISATLLDSTSTQFYKKLVENTNRIANVGGWSVNLQDKSVVVTDHTLSILNASGQEALLPSNFYRLFINEEQVKSLLKTAIFEGNSVDEVLETNGDPSKFIRIIAKPVRKGNKTYKIFGSVQDITAFKEKENFLQLAWNIIDSSEDMICVYNREGTLLHYNQAVSRQLGFTTEQLDRFSIFDLDPEITPSWWGTHFEEVITKKSMRFEWLALKSDGTKVSVEITANHLKYRNTDLNCAIIRDISIRKANEVKLYSALEEVRKLQERLKEENEYLKEEIGNKVNFGNFDQIICKSASYKKVLNQISQVAPTDTTVLITGESGTGKELIARAIHTNSRRKDRPLIKINCATLPKELIESELFGHRKGAFTGAIEAKMGKFTLADKGTIFLDEIGELPLELQPKLLRVLQDGEFDELGGKETLRVDVRVIAATNRDLQSMVANGSFREDLYYRLHVFPIHNIPLRARKEDIPLLGQYFLEKYSSKAGKLFTRLAKQTIEKLLHYHFPGNIRELENLIERAVILEDGPVLYPGSWIPESVGTVVSDELLPFEEMQRRYILSVLEHTGWRVSGPKGAASILHMNDKTLFAKMKRLGIEKKIILKN